MELTIEQHIELIRLTLERHLLYPTLGLVKQDERALESLAVLAQLHGMERAQTGARPSNADVIRQAGKKKP